MSREFHDTYGGYFHHVLSAVSADRPITGEPVADAIRDLMIALSPVEYAVASHQAFDSGVSRVVVAAAAHEKQIMQATIALNKAIRSYSDMVAAIVRENFKEGSRG